MRGRVRQISTSTGGVPKTSVDEAVAGSNGVLGDVQRNTRHHGGPDRALCLWSVEVIEALQAEGHPIGFGFAGENVTLEGLDWESITPGTRLGIGAEILAEVTSYTMPCAANREWFTDGNIDRMNQELHPGWSRVYARVLIGGTMAPGDEVIVRTTSPR